MTGTCRWAACTAAFLCFLGAFLVAGGLAVAQDQPAASDSDTPNRPLKLDYYPNDPPEAEQPAQATAAEVQEVLVEREPYDLLTTKKLTGDWWG
ncbi:MAG: hypothetical protein JXQ75_07330, partial [Phycisphaerae bacterium]|nr:hypothetical protein [Phycisphaerae bacterium]